MNAIQGIQWSFAELRCGIQMNTIMGYYASTPFKLNEECDSKLQNASLPKGCFSMSLIACTNTILT